jgi:5-methylcytosine-specific restriction protein A
MTWARTSRHQRGYGAAWDKLRVHILRRDNGLCQPCLRKNRITPATDVNHIKPKAQGGRDVDENLESSCGPCHDDETLRQQGKRVRPTIGTDGWPEA